MGIFKKAKLFNGAKRVILGVTDAIGITSVLKANIDSKHKIDEQGNLTGVGKIDWIRLIVALCTILGFILVLLGKADKETLKDILKLIH